MPQNLAKQTIARFKSNQMVTCIIRHHSNGFPQRIPAHTDFPPSVQIEITNLCNLRCPTCPRQFMQYPIGTMEMKLFKNIVDQCMDQKTYIKLFFLGEPLLHPCLEQMLSYTYSKRINVTVTTNGTLLTEEKAKFLLNHTSGIAISFDGEDAKSYEAKKAGANFNQVYKNIKHLFELNAQNPKVPVNVTTLMPDKADANAYVIKFAKLWKDTPNFKFSPFITHHYNLQTPLARNYVCLDGLNSLVIRWDGNITFCCGDISTKTILGNAKRDKLATIWNEKRLREIHRHIKNQRYDLVNSCQSCHVSYPKELTFSIPKSLAHLLSFAT